jgi:phosphate transport system permease protein
VKPRPATGRRAVDAAVRLFSGVAAMIAIFMLGWIIWEVAKKGVAAFTPAFFTKLPTPPGIEGGGLANAVLGSGLITLLAVAIGVPVGLFAGIFLAEFGRESKIASVIRFTVNVMMGIPSIIIGVFVYALLVVPAKHFSGLAGAAALALIMLPIMARTTEDMLNLVPNTLRESALALGAPRWKATMGVALRAAKTGLITGAILAIARVSGETAPLLFTAMNSPYWPGSLHEPTANLTVTIFNYAMSPYEDWQRTAWGASLLITAAVLAVTIFTRIGFKEAKR